MGWSHVGAPFWLLLVVALTGTLSTDVVDNGPATTLEQVMLAGEDAGTAAVYGRYNAVGAAAGALGALAAALPGRGQLSGTGVHARLFLVLVPVGFAGAVLAARLSPAVEVGKATEGPGVTTPLGAVGTVAFDGASLGCVVRRRCRRWRPGDDRVPGLLLRRTVPRVGGDAGLAVLHGHRDPGRLGRCRAAVGATVRADRRQWSAPTFRATCLLACVAFAPSFPVAAALLLARTSLSQMDVPTRQALVMTVVTPGERTAAAALTNAARYTVRPLGPLIGGVVQQLALGAPLLLAGVIKGGYDLALWRLGSPTAPARPFRDCARPDPPRDAARRRHLEKRHDRLPAHRRRPDPVAGAIIWPGSTPAGQSANNTASWPNWSANPAPTVAMPATPSGW